MIKVSIIIPVYNVEQFIGDCLRSVFCQTYPNIEIIIVDDCGKDNSMEIVNQIILEFIDCFDVKIIAHEYNRGLSAARNTGVLNSIGDYLFFLDSDDEILSDCIEILIDSLRLYDNADFVIGGVKVIGSSINYPLLSGKILISNAEILTDYLSGKWYVMAWGKLINHEFFLKNEMWFKEGMLHEDELFSFRLAVYANTMISVNKEIYLYKVRSNGSISSRKNLKNYKDELNIVCYNIELIKDKVGINNRYIYSYIIVTLYWLSKSFLTHTKASSCERKKMYIIVQDLISLMDQYKCQLNTKLKIKYWILCMPYNYTLCFMILSTYMNKLFKRLNVNSILFS